MEMPRCLLEQTDQDGTSGQHLIAISRAKHKVAFVQEDEDRNHLGKHQGDEQQSDELAGQAARDQAH